MTSLSGIAPNMFNGGTPHPLIQPTDKNDEITALKPPFPMTKPYQAPPPPPPTDAEMNARFGAAYSVEISSLKMTDGE